MAQSSNRYGGSAATVASGWKCTQLTPPSALYGANGMRIGPDGRLYVAQAFGSQVSAIDTVSGAVSVISPHGGPIVAPDDLAFDSKGTLYITEVMSERVCARSPNGDIRIIADHVSAANGVTVHQDRIFMDECRPNGRLWELFADGRAPRQIADNLPLPNALFLGPDGYIYFPVLGENAIWRVAVGGGRPEPFIKDLGLPTAVKINSKGEIVSTQGRTGEILKIDLQSATKRVHARVRPGLDNFALTADDRIFISHFTDGGVAELMADGSERRLIPPGFCEPAGLAVGGDGVLYAADGISMAAVAADGSQRRVGMLFDGQFPGFVRGVGAAADGNLVVTTSAGDVTTYHPSSHAMTENAKGLQEVYGVAVAPNGAIVVAESGGGRVLAISGKETKTAASGLARPTGIAAAPDGSCYVSEAGKGRVVHINGGVSEVLGGLREPHGVLLSGDDLYIVDVGAHELIRYSTKSRQRETIASKLAVGSPPGVVPHVLAGIPGLLPGPIRPFAGIAQGRDGTIYVSANGEGSILAIRQA
ncbi:MAG: SMP-30/gluconolactonase/LRE family protein [Candidatus Binataceae bacterium]